VRALEGAIEYMEHAPRDFGGHKAQAIADSRKAIEQLRKAMKYRAIQDIQRRNAGLRWMPLYFGHAIPMHRLLPHHA
jgi:hypothetical protein